MALAQNANPLPSNVFQSNGDGLADPCSCLPKQPEEEAVALIFCSIDKLVGLFDRQVKGQLAVQSPRNQCP